MVVQTSLPSESSTTTVEPGSAVPENSGVASLVRSPSAGAWITGASGAVVSAASGSTVKVVVAVSVLPSLVLGRHGERVRSGEQRQRRVAATRCRRSATVVVQTVSPPSVTVIVAPASPVPETSGVRSAVVDPSAGVRMSTVVVVSTSKVTVLGAEVLPAASVAVAE